MIEYTAGTTEAGAQGADVYVMSAGATFDAGENKDRVKAWCAKTANAKSVTFKMNV